MAEADAASDAFDEKIQSVIDTMAALGHPVVVTSRARTEAQQRALYAKGRTAPGNIVTEKSGAPGDESRHQLGTAVDFAFVDAHGNPSYADGHPWDLLGKAAKANHLEWGGDWSTLVDRPHVQTPTVADRPTLEALRASQPPAPLTIHTPIGDTVLPTPRPAPALARAQPYAAGPPPVDAPLETPPDPPIAEPELPPPPAAPALAQAAPYVAGAPPVDVTPVAPVAQAPPVVASAVATPAPAPTPAVAPPPPVAQAPPPAPAAPPVAVAPDPGPPPAPVATARPVFAPSAPSAFAPEHQDPEASLRRPTYKLSPLPATLSAFAPDPEDRLIDGQARAAGTPADTAARVLNLQLQTGLSPEVIGRHVDELEQQVQAAGFNADEFRRTSPALATWMEQQPLHAALVQDDLVPLTALEQTLGFTRRILADPALTLAKGFIAVPEAAVGLADIVSKGHAGQALAEYAGFRPDIAKAVLGMYYSKAQQGAFRNVQEADGMLATAVALLQNPSVIAHSVVENLPLMLASGAAGRGLGLARWLSPALADVVAGAAGEGAAQAGSAAEQSRQGAAQGSEKGLITGKQAALATSSGVATGILGVFGGKVAQKLGIADVDTMLAAAAVSPTARHGFVKSMIYGAIEEGLLEEFPQSVQEQVHQNYADGRPLWEGVDQAAVMGAVVGGVMGSGANAWEHIGGQASEPVLKKIAADVKAAKITERSPDKLAEFIDSAVGAASTVYAPLETWDTYWQGKGEDPRAKAIEILGNATAYDEASSVSGADLPIPTSVYATKLAVDHGTFFQQELRLEPGMMNARESAAALPPAEGAVNERQVAAGADIPTPRDQVREALTQQLIEGGRYTPEVAAQIAKLAEAGYGTMAEAAGENPFDVYARYGLEVTRPELGPADIRTPPVETVKPASPLAGETAPAVRPVKTPEYEAWSRLLQTAGAAYLAAHPDATTAAINAAAQEVAGPMPANQYTNTPAPESGTQTDPPGEPTTTENRDSAAPAAAAATPGPEAALQALVDAAPSAEARDAILAAASVDATKAELASPEEQAGRAAIRDTSDGQELGPAREGVAEADALSEALQGLQATGTAYGPGGLRVRVQPRGQSVGSTAPRTWELEITEKGRRTFEGRFTTNNEAIEAGAERLVALAAEPTPAIVTPQIGPPAPVTGPVTPPATTTATIRPRKGSPEAKTAAEATATREAEAVNAATAVAAVEVATEARTVTPGKPAGPWSAVTGYERQAAALNMRNMTSAQGLTRSTIWHVDSVTQRSDVVTVTIHTTDAKTGKPTKGFEGPVVYEFRVPGDFVLPVAATFNGETVRYTGKTVEDSGVTLHEVTYVGGASAGQTALITQAPPRKVPAPTHDDAGLPNSRAGIVRAIESTTAEIAERRARRVSVSSHEQTLAALQAKLAALDTPTPPKPKLALPPAPPDPPVLTDKPARKLVPRRDSGGNVRWDVQAPATPAPSPAATPALEGVRTTQELLAELQPFGESIESMLVRAGVDFDTLAARPREAEALLRTLAAYNREFQASPDRASPESGQAIDAYVAALATRLEAPEEPTPVGAGQTAAAAAATATPSYQVQINDGSGWSNNALRFASRADAEAHGLDIMDRWSGAREYRVVESTDPVNRPAPELVANKSEEAQTQKGPDDQVSQTDPAEDGASAGSEPGEPARRPGDRRAEAVAGEQPAPESSVPGEPATEKPPRKRRPPKSARDPGAGDGAPGGRDEPGAGPGVRAPEHVDPADDTEDPDVAVAISRGEPARDFVIDDAKALTGTTWQSKLEDNLAAIRLLKALTTENRMATDAEQAVIARYIGWGHTNLAPIVSNDPHDQSLRERDPRLQKARTELELILTKEELRELGLSTPNAHYSFADLPRAMWTALEHLGFHFGIILEPAVGTGHFLGTMPGPMRAHRKTKVWGVEKEPMAAAIARQLYQTAKIINAPLQEANLPAAYFDLGVSNVPFGRIEIFDPDFMAPAQRALATRVHNYYFGKQLDLTRPGGLVAFVTSRYTMDERSDTVRNYLAARADFLGAVRLPDQAFNKTAGTQVVTDIIFLQVRAPGEAPSARSLVSGWTQSSEHKKLSKEAGRPIFQNDYFQDHPSFVLGKQDLSGKLVRTRDAQYNVAGTVAFDQIVRALQTILPADVYTPSKAAPRKLAENVPRDIKQGTFQVDKGQVYLYDKGTLTPSGLTGEGLARALNYVKIRDAYQSVLDVMMANGSDADLKQAQRGLLSAYKFYVATHGFVNEPLNRRLIERDPNSGRVLALEAIQRIKRQKGRPAELNVTGLADIMKVTKEGEPATRTIVPVVEATHADTPAAALTQSLAWKGGVDLAYMAGLTDQTPAQLIAALEGDIYQDPVSHSYIAHDEYLSGDVTTKLAQAQAAATMDASYTQNVAALTKVLPTQFTAEDFPAPFGATWVPPAVYEAFLREETQSDTITVKLTNNEARVKFYVEGYGDHEFLPAGEDLDKWLARALNGELPRIEVGRGANRVFSQEATDAYRESMIQLREHWADWWPADPHAAEQLTKIYNGLFNRDSAYVADGAHLVLKNANPLIKLRPWQKNVIWRVLQTGNTLMAHAVGAGKTYAMIGIAAEWKRLGLANKPMVVVPNHLIDDWERAFLELYPGARVLVASKEDFQTQNRKRLIARIANNDWDAVIMAQSQFLSTSVKIETLQAYIQEQEDQLLGEGAAQMQMTAEDFADLVADYGAGDKAAMRRFGRGAPRSAKDIARAILNLRARLQKRINQQAKTSPVTFEELGVDGLLIDEAHLYKNLYFSTAMNNVAGLKGSDAQRSMDMFLKVRHINKASNSRNVVFATGTPVSNAISELYTMFRYLAQEKLDRMGMSGFDSWAHGNAMAVAQSEPAAGGGYKEVTRLRKWTNLRELSAQFRQFADVVTTKDLIDSGELKLPKMKNGHPTVMALEPHPLHAAYMASLKARLEALKTGRVNPKDDNYLLVNTQAGLASIDMRLVDPTAPPDPNGRIQVAAREIGTRYRALNAQKGVQLVFLDVGVPKGDDLKPLPWILDAQAVPAVAETAADEEEGDDDIVDLEAEGAAAMAEIEKAGHMRDLYSELKAQLVAQGIPADEVIFLQQADNAYEQGTLYERVNDGRVRVLIASTAKGGVGMNVQKQLAVIHHLDVPWRPADMEQRNGRIFRQKNSYDEVEEVRYVTLRSFDEYRWGLLAEKQQQIVALMKGEATEMEDIDPAQLDMEIARALASGDARTMQLITKEREMKGLLTRYRAFTTRLNTARRAIKSGLDLIDRLIEAGAALEPIIAASQAWHDQPAPILSLFTSAHRSYRGDATPVDYDWKDTESRKAAQAAIEAMLTSEPYQESLDLGEAGPYVLSLLRSKTSAFDTKVRAMVDTTQYYIAVKVLPPTGGSVSVGVGAEWSVGTPFPSFTRSLDSLLSVARVQKERDDDHRRTAQIQADVTRQQEIAAKPFAQIDLMNLRQQELHELRVALGVAQAPHQHTLPAAPDDDQQLDQPPADAPPPDRPMTGAEGVARSIAAGSRGNIQFGVNPATGDLRTIINLLAGADLSTFLHETGHLFLRVFGDLAEKLQQTGDRTTWTPEQIRFLDDWDDTLEALGVTSRAEIGTPQQEQWATAFEAYLREGQAPSRELQAPFARFRQWLLEVYRSARHLAPVSPELRGIFDRMLASEAEIRQVEQDQQADALITTAGDVKMSPHHFAMYREKMAAAARTTREQLDRKVLDEVRRRRSADGQAARAALETQVRAQVEAEPVYQARKTILEDKITLNRAQLLAQFDDERIANLPEGLTAQDGADPELVATALGYSSADELLTALATAPPLEAAIAAETEKRWAAIQPSILTDGSLFDEAKAASANADREAVIRAELEALYVTRETKARDYERRFLEAEAKLRIQIAEGYKAAQTQHAVDAEHEAGLERQARAAKKTEAQIDALKQKNREQLARQRATQQKALAKLQQTVKDLKTKAREARALARGVQKTGDVQLKKGTLPSAKDLRQQAETHIGGYQVRDIATALRVAWATMRQAGKRAVANAAAGDIDGAIKAKTQELVNLAYFQEARRVQEEIAIGRRWVVAHDTRAARAETGLAGSNYLDQWDALLDRFEFKKVSQKVLDRRVALAAFVAQQTAAGMPMTLSPLLIAEAGRINYQDLTVDQFRGMTDGMKQLLHLARLKLKLLRAGARRDFLGERDALVRSIRAKTPARKMPLEFRPADQKWRAIADGIASHATLSTIGYALDGHEYGGPFWDAIVRPANEAASAEETRNKEASAAYHAILEQHYPGRKILSFGDKVFIPAIGASLSLEARLAVAQNWGNQSSRARVLADPVLLWSPNQVAAVLDTLEKNDWDFVQAHFDYLNTYWPEIAAKSERLTGLPPEKVEAAEIVTKFGTYPGGYHPIVFDYRKSSEVGVQEQASEARMKVAGAYLAQTTRRGHEITRLTNVHLPLRLDQSATTGHLAQVIHDLTHHEMLIDATRLLRDKQLSAAIHETQGDIVAGKLGRLFSDIATGDRIASRPTLAENGATWLRTRSQLAGLAWNLWTGLQQPLGMFNGMERVGVTWVAKGAVRWLRDAAHFENTVAMIAAKSPMMRSRSMTASQDLHDLRHSLTTEGTWFDRLVRTVSADHATQQTLTDSYMWFIGVGQRVADVPTWLGGYEKQLSADPTDEARAVALADQAVLDSQGGGQIKDLAEVQRGGPIAKLFMTFASYGVTVNNAAGRAIGKTEFRSPASVATLLGHLSLLYIIPALFTEALRCGVNRAKCDEVPQFVARVGGQSVSTALNGLMYVREAAAAVNVAIGQDTGPRGYEGTAGTRLFQLLDTLATQVHQGTVDSGLAKAAFAAAGLVFRFPAAQVQRTVDGFIALEEGRTHNPVTALLFGPPPKPKASEY